MKKRMILFLSVVVVFAFHGSLLASAIRSPTQDFYVNDFAGVLSSETKRHIVDAGLKLREDTTAQVVVVTVDSIENEDIFNYSLNLAREWGIGDQEKDNGCLIFLSIEDKKSYIQVGYGLEGRLTDGKTGKLQDDYLIPYLKEEEYDEGVENLFNAIIQEVYSEYGIESPDGIEPQKRKEPFDGGIIIGFLMIIGVMAFAIWSDKTGWASNVGTGSSSWNSRDRDSGSSNSRGGGGSFGGGGSGRSW